MKTAVLTLTACWLLSSPLFARIVVNEIMYAPADATNEWFELVNTGNDADLSGWKWKDATSALRTITNTPFILRKDSLIVVCQDSVKFRSLYPQFRGKLFQTAWSALNNSGDSLILIDQNGQRSDSLSYSSAWGGASGGYSLERKNPLAPSAVASNWASSVNPLRATPGAENSVKIRDYDLSVTGIRFEPKSPVAGSPLDIVTGIRNEGLNAAAGAVLRLYDDLNLDTVNQPGELIFTQSLAMIPPEDSAYAAFTMQNVQSGRKQFIAEVTYTEDLDSSDNELARSVYVSIPGQAGSIVMNEIMYDPQNSGAEWVELCNPSGAPFDLAGWKLTDNTSNLTISETELILAPGGYLVIASDSAVLSEFPQAGAVKVMPSLSLSNSGETLILSDSLSSVIDRVSYSPLMHNPGIENTKGVSLERINPALPSSQNTNWTSCADISGGTPGRKNSMFAPAVLPVSGLRIEPNPFSPDGDGVDDVAVISCSTGFVRGTVRAEIYDARGRKVRTLAHAEPAGSEKTFVFNGYDDEGRKLNVGLYIIVIEAIDNIAGSPVPFKGLVVVAAKL